MPGFLDKAKRFAQSMKSSPTDDQEAINARNAQNAHILMGKVITGPLSNPNFGSGYFPSSSSIFGGGSSAATGAVVLHSQSGGIVPKGATYEYPPESYAARVEEAGIDQCVVSMSILSVGVRKERVPVEIAASRFLLPDHDPKVHSSYSFDKFVQTFENKLNAELAEEPIEIRYGILGYFHRGDHKKVRDQDDFEVAISRLHLARGRDNIMKFQLQPEFEDHTIERRAREAEEREEAEAEARAKRVADALANANIEDNKNIERLVLNDEEASRTESKGKKTEREIRTPPRTAEGKPQDDATGLSPGSGVDVPVSPTLFSPKSTTSTEARPLSPNTPESGTDNIDDVFTDLVSTSPTPPGKRRASIKSSIKNLLPNKHKLDKSVKPDKPKKQSKEEQMMEWNKLYLVESRRAFRSGGDDEGWVPEVNTSTLDQELMTEEKDDGLLEDDDGEDENIRVPSAADRVVQKLQNLQNLPELSQMDDPNHPGENFRWNECCKMFKLDPSKTTPGELVALAGLKTKIYQYQAFGVYWQMTTSRKLGGGCVADGMGLGKTLSFLAFFVVERQLAHLWQEVDHSRKARDGKHLREDEHMEGDICPTSSKPGWISCPCASSSPTSNMPPKPGVRLACVPEKLVRSWWAEWKRHVDVVSDQGALGLNLVLDHQRIVTELNLADQSTNINTAKTISRMTMRNESESHQSGYLLLTTIHSFKDTIKKFEMKGYIDAMKTFELSKKGRVPEKYKIIFGIAMIDESHEEYFKETGRGKVLCDLPSRNQPFIWGYSGTPFSQTPRGLDGVLWAMEQHAKHSQITWADHPVLGQFENNKLMQICHNFDKECHSEQPDYAKVDEILTSFKPFLLKLVIRRTASTLWFGNRLIRLKPHIHQDIFLTANLAVRAEFKHGEILEYESRFQDEKERKLLELQQKWDQFPNKRQSSTRPAKLKFNTICRLQWRLRILATFPNLIKLVTSEDDESRVNLTEQELLDYVQIGNKIRDNPYYRHMRNIMEDSPKLLWLHPFIDNLIKQKDYQGEPQKLIIMSTFPQVICILNMFLLKYFPDMKDEIGVILPRMKMKERTATLDAFTDAYDERGNRKQKRSNQILIGTTRLIGTGLQLTRAANTILMEPDYEFVNEAQAYGRVHRIGQKNDCSFSYRLIMSKSDVEMGIVRRQQDRKEAFGRVLAQEEFDQMFQAKIEEVEGATSKAGPSKR